MPKQKNTLMGPDNFREFIEASERLVANAADWDLPPPPPEWHWFATQARAYLDGKYATIDEALGLDPTRVKRTLHQLLGLDQPSKPAPPRLRRKHP